MIADEAMLELCYKATERNVGSVLLPEMRYTKEKLQPFLKAFAQHKQDELAFATLEAIKQEGGVKLKAPNYTTGISACARSKSTQKALKLFEAMPVAQVEPNVISYNATISACEKCERWHQALNIFMTTPKAKVQQDVTSYNAAISAFEKGGQCYQALKLFETMLEAKVQQDVISYRAAMSACEKGGHWQQALKMFKAMSKAKIPQDIISYNALFDCMEIRNGPIGYDFYEQCILPTFFNLRKCDAAKIDLHELSEGAACLALCYWLTNKVYMELENKKQLICIIVSGQGKSRKDWSTSDIRQAALKLLLALKLEASLLPENPGRVRLVLTKNDLPMLSSAFHLSLSLEENAVKMACFF